VDSSEAHASFGELLRQHRLARALTQEALAQRAGLSAHGIQKLERGSTRPYRDTAERLSRAMELTADAEVRFKAAARPVPRRHSIKPLVPDHSGHNLPLQTTSFIGRQEDVAKMRLRLKEYRLLTVTGTGGCGKTRLALEVGRTLVDEFRDGVWLINLAPLSDPSLVWQSLATILRIREEPRRPLAEAVTDYLRDRNMLIILDNCEHLIDACATVVDILLREAANLRVLATTRELLRLEGEAAWPLGPLSVVDPTTLETPVANRGKTVVVSEAARLFADRARLVRPAFQLSNENAPAVAQICQRLDGIPLAIELAAARLSVLSVDEVLARLDQRFRLLTGGYRTAVQRQQTLRATIDWSYGLLTDPERAVFRSLSVFAGGWSLQAAEAVSSDTTDSNLDPVEMLSQLVHKSMVIMDEVREAGLASTRYRYLQTIREYAEEKLVASGEAEAARSRHSDWCIHLAEDAEQALESSDQLRWLDRLDTEIDNLRVSLTWLAAQPDANEQFLHLVGLLGRFWRDRTHLEEGVGWLATALDRLAPSTPSTADRVRVLNWLGIISLQKGDVQRARMLLEEGVAHARAVGDGRLVSQVLRHHAEALVATPGGLGAFESPQLREHDHRRADELLEDALRVSRAIANKRETAFNLSALAEHQITLGRRHGAEERLQEAMAIGRESGDPTPLVYSMVMLARLHMSTGAIPQARRLVEDALAIVRQQRLHAWFTSMLLVLSGDISVLQGDWHAAGEWYREALRSLIGPVAQASMAHPVRRYATVLSARGEHRRAVRLLATVASVTEAMWGDQSMLSFEVEGVLNSAREALGEADFAQAWTRGESITLAQATAEILSDADQ
jgi:predicted ATPase/DNA-binding XRE family transcriptional regulator